MTVRALFSMGVNVLGGIYIVLQYRCEKYYTETGSAKHQNVAWPRPFKGQGQGMCVHSYV